MNTKRHQQKRQLRKGRLLKNEDNSNNEDYPKNEKLPQNEDDPKKKMTKKNEDDPKN